MKSEELCTARAATCPCDQRCTAVYQHPDSQERICGRWVLAGVPVDDGGKREARESQRTNRPMSGRFEGGQAAPNTFKAAKPIF